MSRKTLLLVCGAVLLCAARADAANCTVSVTSVSFGSYNVFTAAPTDSTGTIVLDCSGNASNVAIEISRGGGATFGTRRLAKGTESLFYNIYRNAARTSIWGNGNGSSQTVVIASVPNQGTTSRTMFGRIPAGQDISTGAYADSLTVTVNF